MVSTQVASVGGQPLVRRTARCPERSPDPAL